MTTSLAETRTPVRGPGGITRWVTPRTYAGPVCIECDKPVRGIKGERCTVCEPRYQARIRKAEKDRLARAERTARLHTLRALGAHPALRTICPDCDGLTYLGETCVCVRLWCRQVENEWNRRAA